MDNAEIVVGVAAARTEASSVVVGRGGLGISGGQLLGSVTGRLVTGEDAPVVMVPLA